MTKVISGSFQEIWKRYCEEPKVRGREFDDWLVEQINQLATVNAKLLAVCEAFVSLFRNSDMRPEDECHELYGQMEAAIVEAHNLATPKPGARDSVP